jgi:hypothetical protein
MKELRTLLPFAFFGLLLLSGCLVDKGELVEDVPPGYCDSLNATYVDTMKTLIDTYCATSSGCHGTLSSNGDFTSYAAMQSFGVLDSLGVGARVVSPDPVLLMPLGNPLPDSLQRVFKCWADKGYPQE